MASFDDRCQTLPHHRPVPRAPPCSRRRSALCALGLLTILARLAGVPPGPFNVRVHPLAVSLMTPAVASILVGWQGRAWLATRLATVALAGTAIVCVLQVAFDVLPSLGPHLDAIRLVMPARQAMLSIAVTALMGLPRPLRVARFASRAGLVQVWGSLLLALLATTSLVTWASPGAADSWLQYLLMSPQLSACCLMVASAVLSDCMVRGEASWQGWLPVALTIFVSACAVIFSQALHSQEHASVRRQAAAEAYRLRNALLQQVAAMETGLDRVRARYESGAVDTQRAWEADAQEHLRGYDGVVTSLVVADPTGWPRWVVPAALAGSSPQRRGARLTRAACGDRTRHRHARAGGVLATP